VIPGGAAAFNYREKARGWQGIGQENREKGHIVFASSPASLGGKRRGFIV